MPRPVSRARWWFQIQFSWDNFIPKPVAVKCFLVDMICIRWCPQASRPRKLRPCPWNNWMGRSTVSCLSFRPADRPPASQQYICTWAQATNLYTPYEGNIAQSRGKSLLELWVTTLLPDWQPLLIFVRFISNFLCMYSNSMVSAHVILK